MLTGFRKLQEVEVQDQVRADDEYADQQEVKDEVPHNVIAGFPVYFSVIHTTKDSTNIGGAGREYGRHHQCLGVTEGCAGL
ncbi:hypothetical protein [Faecalibaculum rodentium]|uniref:hypothetical protein n=1 Tax=Faecalibaculum rodentium TaxID=1702221 RepID=UPI0025704239|nr:hypothetical protein [Faecalibaculum rodentium]